MTDPEQQKRLSQRLKRAEGQVAAIRRMLDSKAPCIDVLVQLSAAQGALNKAAQILLSAHIEQCVQETFESDDQAERGQRVSELMHLFDRFGRLGGRSS